MKLGTRLDEAVSWEQKRSLIKVLVAGVRVETVEECGVKQTKTTVTHGFSQPDKAMPLVLPQSCSTGRVVRIPTVPQTVGDHIRRRRLGLKSTQRAVANQMGVAETSVFNWGANTSDPELWYMPAIIGFLGCSPLPEASGLGEWLVRHRTSLGMTQEEAAKRLGVDAGTLARWEQGERKPDGVLAARAGRFLETEEATQVPDVRTA